MSVSQIKKRRPPSLVNLCLGVVGKHLEDIIDDLPEIASTFPSHIRVRKKIQIWSYITKLIISFLHNIGRV